MFKAIIFDFNGLFAKPIEARIIGSVCSATGAGLWVAHSNYRLAIRNFELGMESPRAFWQRVFPQLNEQEYAEFVEEAYEKPFEKNNGLYDLAEKLSANYRLFCLSNSNFLQGKACRKQNLYYPFESFFLSHEIRAIKPFPSAYRHVLSATGLRASECVFVDDSTFNVMGAMLVGFKGIVFNDNADLAGKLGRLKII